VTINFIEIKCAEKFQGSFLDTLKLLNFNKTEQFLRIAFRHGGYIAGGFGITVARYAISHSNLNFLKSNIAHHLGTHSQIESVSLRDNNIAANNFAKANHGDIDVWFANSDQLSSFMNDPERLEMWNNKEFFTEKLQRQDLPEFKILILKFKECFRHF
jgi:hypothetical protein